MLELLIRNGRVLDGTGSPWRRADVGVADGRIVAVRPYLDRPAARTIDAADRIVAPGFIDLHSHSDLLLLADPRSSAKIRQGVTTEVFGVDGLCPAPVRPEAVAARRRYLGALEGNPDAEWTWSGLDDYLDTLEAQRPSPNLVGLVAHGAVRDWVMGLEQRPATSAEIDQMCGLVAEALAAGAPGLSTGLIYIPCAYADQAELRALCRTVGRHGGFIDPHIRNEGDGLLDSLDEMIGLCRDTGAALHVSHLKVIGRDNWPHVEQVFGKIETARREGLDITFDQYPYVAGCTIMSALLPAWAHDGGPDALLRRLADPMHRDRMRREIADGVPGWENLARACGWEGIVIASVGSETNRAWEGRTLAALAEARAVAPADALFDLLLDEDLQVGMIDFYGSEDVTRQILAHPLQTVCTDGILGGKPHPRLHGTFPRILGRYVREEGVLSLPEAVRKMTGAAASRLGWQDRGLVREGSAADLVVFDPERVIDRATYDAPTLDPVGITWVVVNGQVALADGQETGVGSGRALRA